MAMDTTNKTYASITELDGEIARIRKQIESLEHFILHNRMDGADVRETQAEITALELELTGLRTQRQIMVAKRKHAPTPAQPIMPEPQPHNPATYISFANPKRLDELRAQYRILDDELMRLDDKIFACDINTDTAESRDPELAAQVAKDRAEYEGRAADIRRQAKQIMAQIWNIEKFGHLH